ncbi:HsdM family class I SAM-dependent methyltransferase [Endozoicomonas euniceicola]|uniref:site-specific DNA-methyltransferase (adenine-specific) n=1 Tax=Endozoicomonas euniceicola TaxID=1234143 RepID=A0ABY6GXR9_9GAMM|nr:class I SAM-dependent DNA methyltransferase [Endozoicomonas euniceicola]UYM17572.1 type I restriction-modification system subunit M [Endozoicomonas euniceicola]
MALGREGAFNPPSLSCTLPPSTTQAVRQPHTGTTNRALASPEHARWGEIISRTENIGEAIDEAFADIEAQNSYLEGVLTAIQFGDKAKLGDELPSRLLRHFNQYNLGNDHLYKADMLGDAYEYLIKQFADDAGKKGGEFYTPKPVVQLLVNLLDPQPGHTVYDPTSGSGGMLVESAHHVAQLPNGTIAGQPNILLYGQEKKPRHLGHWQAEPVPAQHAGGTGTGRYPGSTPAP